MNPQPRPLLDSLTLAAAACTIATVCLSSASPPVAAGQRDVSPSTAASALNASYALQAAPSRTIAATYTYSVSVPQLVAEDWELFAPRPVDLPGQAILRAATLPDSVVIADASALKQPLFRVRVPATSGELRRGVVLTIDVDARLFARRLVPRTVSQPVGGPDTLPENDRKRALGATGQFNYDDRRVKAWLADRGLNRGAEEGEVDYARRVFQEIARSFQYDYRGEQDRSAAYVAVAGRSDCGGLAALWVTALRAAGVPARTLAGRWAVSARPGQRIGTVVYVQEHVKAEFFAQGVGWIPGDLSSAVLHDQSPGKLRFFGNDPGDFLTFHLDTDLSFDTRHFGRKTCTLLQRPCYWVAGSGSLQGSFARESWEVRSAGPTDPPPRGGSE